MGHELVHGDDIEASDDGVTEHDTADTTWFLCSAANPRKDNA